MTSRQPLHIVQVVSSRRHAGVENYVGRIAELLTQRRHRVSVVSRIPCSTFVSDASETFDVANWREASRVVRRLADADIIHSHTTEADTAAVWAARGRRVPIVSTRHFATRRWSIDDGQGSALLRLPGMRAKPSKNPILRHVRERIDKRIDMNVAVSDFVASRMGGCDAVVRTGIATQDDLTPVEERSPKAILLQRLEPHKQAHVALEAWGRSTARMRGWSLEVHGEGRDSQRLTDLVAHLDLAESVRIMGRCSDSESLLRSASLLLAPGFDDPFPLTVLEAMSFGVPVIASASGGHMESIAQVPDAPLFPVGRSDLLAGLIDTYTSDPVALRRLSMNEIEVQREHFSTQVMCDRIEDLYHSLVESRN